MAIKIQGSTIIDDSRKVINASHVGIGTTNPTVELDVDGNANISGIVTAGEFKELYNGQYWSVVTQADVGYGASQVPLNQYLGQLAFLDDHHPNGLRRDGASSDDVFVNSSGYVGIGSAQPTVKLDVDGDARITGILTVGTVKISSGIVTAVSGVVTYYGDGSNLTNIAAAGAIEGLTIIDQSGSTVGTAGSISSLSFEGSTAVTVTGTTGAAGIATVLISAPGELNDLSDVTTKPTSILIGTGVSTNSTENTVIGQEAGANIGSLYGRKNTFVGYQAGKFVGNEENVAIGNQALGGATGSVQSSVARNVAIGDRALSQIQGNAINNTVVGTWAGYALTTATSNTLLGYSAGYALTTGSDNTLLGWNAGVSITTGDNNICIGYGADASSATVSDEITLGNSGITKFRIPGLNLVHNSTGIGIGSTQPTAKVDVQGDVRISKAATNANPHLRLFAEDSNGSFIIAEHASDHPDLEFKTRVWDGSSGSTLSLFKGAAQETVGSSTFDGIGLEDNKAIIFGTGNDSYMRYDPTPGLLEIRTVVSEPITFGTNNVERLRITSGGDIGIGSTQPTAKLDVNGTLNVSGISTFNDDVTFDGATAGRDITFDRSNNALQFEDSAYAKFGTDDGLQIYHNGNASYISNYEGTLFIDQEVDGGTLALRSDNGSGSYIEYIECVGSSGEVKLYHFGSQKLATKSNGIDVTGHTETDTLNVSGISTFQNSVTISGAGNTSTIAGPSNLVLDPAAVGDATGTVIILGDLQVDGTQTIINSTTLEVDDKLVSIAKSATNAAQANGAGLEINGASATLTYASTGDKWVFNKAPYYNTNRLLTTADEGTGNGLDADTLDGHDSLSFLRSDATAIKSTGDLRFNNNVGLTFGGSDNSRLFHDGTDLSLDLTAYVTDFKIRDGTTERYTFTKAGQLSLVDINASGISTLGTVKISSGIVTASSGIVTYYGDGSSLTNVDADTLAGISSTSFLRSDAADAKTSGDLTFNDNVRAQFGTGGTPGQKLDIYHNTANAIITNGDGSIYISATQNGERVHIQSDNGSGGVADYFAAYGNTGEARLYHFGSEKLATKAYGIDVTGRTETDSLNVSGISTLGTVKISSGIVTASSGIVTYYGDGSQLTGISAGGSSPWITTGYTGIGTTSAVGIGTRIEIIPYDTQNNGTLSFEGSAGQLFSITNDLTTGSIFSVNDVSGIPSIDVDADGTIQLAPFGATEFVGIGTTNPTAKLDVDGTVALGSSVYDTNGTFGGNGQVLSNVTGFGVSWTTVSSGGGSVWSTSGNDAYYTTGNVGINSTSPTSTLDVNGTLNVSGISTFQNHVNLGDNDELRIGNDTDAVIKVDGSENFHITSNTTTASFYLRAANVVNIGLNGGSGGYDSVIKATYTGGTKHAELYCDNNLKLETNNSGISVSGNIEKYDTLVGSASTTVVQFTVTVAAKSDHRYTGGVNGASTNGYYLDGIESPFLTFTPGRTYRFDQSDSSNGSHPLRFYLDAAKTTEYTYGVTVSGTHGNANAYVEIEVTDETPTILHYQCGAHPYMGNAIQTNGSNLVNGRYDVSPNNIVPVNSLSAIGAAPDIDVAIVPKGSGSFSLDVPDGTSTGGNKRGALSVDLQMSRSNASDVAAGMYSFLGGGVQNEIGTNGTACGIVAGDANEVGGSSVYSAVVGGYFNRITNGFNSIILSGSNNILDSDNSVVIGGYKGTTKGIHGIVVLPASNRPLGSGVTNGAVQSTILNLARDTTDATPTVIASDNTAASTDNQLVLLNNSAVAFKGTCIAGVTGAGNTKAWEFRGAIKRGANAASTTLVGSVIKDVLAYDTGAAAWDVDFTADTTNGGLKVTVTGQVAPYTIRWVCKIETTELAF